MAEPTLEQRKGVVEHLSYEIGMLRAAALALSSPSPRGWVESNALVEALALHTRNLVDFFYNTPNPRFPDDVLAQHFVRDVAAWVRERPAKSQQLARAKVQADKQVSHLTYARVGLSLDQKAWSPALLLGEIESLVALFLRHADPEVVKISPEGQPGNGEVM
jgi:hypothetical protein